MASIPEAFHDLFERETYAVFGTVMPEGTPQLTPVWIDRETVDHGGADATADGEFGETVDGEADETVDAGDREAEGGEDRLLVNTARGRRKERNVARDPKVGVCVLDPDDPYRYVSVRGEVEEVTEEGAVEHIDRLARQYMDVERYPNHGEERGPRVIVRIRPDRVVTNG